MEAGSGRMCSTGLLVALQGVVLAGSHSSDLEENSSRPCTITFPGSSKSMQDSVTHRSQLRPGSPELRNIDSCLPL